MIFYFSGTGNSLWVAQELANAFGEQIKSMVEALKETSDCSLSEGEGLGIVFPVYSWGPPSLVLKFLEKFCLSEVPVYPYFVCTCGDDTGKTEQIMQAAAARKGWKFRAGYSVTMPNTYVCMSGFDVDSSEEEQRKLQAAEARIQQIKLRLQSRTTEFDCHEGSMPWIKSYIIRPWFNRFAIAPHKFRASSDCIACGKCVKVCPMQNISLADGRPVWGKHCTMCLACYHHCPKHVVEYGTHTKKKGQYLHPLVRSVKKKTD